MSETYDGVVSAAEYLNEIVVEWRDVYEQLMSLSPHKRPPNADVVAAVLVLAQQLKWLRGDYTDRT